MIDHCLDSLFAWTCHDAVIGVKDIDHALLVEDTFVDVGFLESNFLELGAQVLILDSSNFFCPYMFFLILKMYSPLYVEDTARSEERRVLYDNRRG